MKKIAFLLLTLMCLMTINTNAKNSTQIDEDFHIICWEGPLSCGAAFAACAFTTMELVSIVLEADSIICGNGGGGGEENEKLN